MLRSSSCLPKLTTVRAVMVRAAMEKKKEKKSRAERPSVSGGSGQLHVQIGCKFIIERTGRIETSKQSKTNSELKQTNYKLRQITSKHAGFFLLAGCNGSRGYMAVLN